MCIVSTNIECIRNGLQVHQHTRDQMFKILLDILQTHILECYLPDNESSKFIVSENTQITIGKESLVKYL